MKKGQTIRILDVEGNQSGDCIFYNADNPEERYRLPGRYDDVAQENIFLTTGTKMMSSEGNVMMVDHGGYSRQPL